MVLPKDIIEQHLWPHRENWKNLYLNSTIIRKLTIKNTEYFKEEEESAVTELLLVYDELSDNSKNSLEDEKGKNIDDMIQKLRNIYGSYFSKIAVVDNMQLIAASLKDQKPQYIIATVLTTMQ
ncbi:16666_t:CDS:2, partial [Racocetra persica]